MRLTFKDFRLDNLRMDIYEFEFENSFLNPKNSINFYKIYRDSEEKFFLYCLQFMKNFLDLRRTENPWIRHSYSANPTRECVKLFRGGIFSFWTILYIRTQSVRINGNFPGLGSFSRGGGLRYCTVEIRQAHPLSTVVYYL